MASNKTYISYASEAYFEASNVYMEGNSNKAILEKLRELGARRILFICSEKIRKFKNFEKINSDYEKFGFRCFVYARKTGLLTDKDVLEAVSVCREYNCDTVVTVGGSSEVDCGKLCSAMITNGVKSPTELSGLNAFKRDMSLVCCIVTDNSANASLPTAEFLDTTRKKWNVAYSSFLMPQIVVFDSEICMRNDLSDSVDGALAALCMAIESYISPVATMNPSFKADALLAIQNIIKSLDKMVNVPEDSYIRQKLACGGFYAGIASARTGYGYTHVIVHSLLERYGDIHSVIYLQFLIKIIRLSLEFTEGRVSSLARELHICTVGLSDRDAAESFLNTLERIAEKYSNYGFIPLVSDSEVRKIAEEVRHESMLFELRRITNDTVISVFSEVAADR